MARRQSTGRAPSPTDRPRICTTQYVPGQGIVSTSDVLISPIALGKAKKAIGPLPDERFAYGIASDFRHLPDGGTRAGTFFFFFFKKQCKRSSG